MTAADEALEALRNRILAGLLPAGSKLHQEQLASSLGMSRIPVRDAIRTLASEGLVQQHANRTATVAPISTEDLAELYEVRIAIEPVASALAVPNLRSSDILIMRSLISSMGDGDDDAHWLDNNDEFHSALYHRSGRPRMIALLDQARAQTRRYTGLRLDADRTDLLDEHQLILAAADRRDPAAVKALVKAHLVSAFSIVRKQIEAFDQLPNGDSEMNPHRVEGGS